MKPDSSRKTSVAPRRLAFFLDGEAPRFASVRPHRRPVLVHVSRASEKSIRGGTQGFFERGRHGSRRRTDRGSVVAPGDKSRGRSTTRKHSPHSQGVSPIADAGHPLEDGYDQDEVLQAPFRHSRPQPSASGSPMPDLPRPFVRPWFGCGPPLTMTTHVVDDAPVPLHFLLVSCVQYKLRMKIIH